jgi:threonine/homoserine/homoserine lactone efflux protein
MEFGTWIAFALLETFLCLTPGPAVLFVTGTALARGRHDGFFAAAGIVAGNVAYFVLSAMGLSAILLASHRLFAAVTWLGAAYLAYLGLRALLGRGVDAQKTEEPGPAAGRTRIVGGALTQLANPKALIFFAALLPQFIDPRRPLAAQILILGVTSQAIEALVLSAYVLLAGALAAGVRRRRFAAAFDRISGLLLLGAAVRLAVMERL